MWDKENTSLMVGRAAAMLAMSLSRTEEAKLKTEMKDQQIRCAAVDFGGDYSGSVMKMVEKAILSARREGVIGESSHEEGAVAGAVHEAIAQVAGKAIGLSVGGKIAVARYGEHVAAAVFFSIGLIHLNEVCIGMGHRSI